MINLNTVVPYHQIKMLSDYYEEDDDDYYSPFKIE